MGKKIEIYHYNINEISKDKLDLIHEFSIKVVSETYDRMKYDYNRRIETIEIGKIAEEIFALYIKEKYMVDFNINYDIYPGVENGDGNDFIINGYSFDIKSSKDTKNEGILNCLNYFNFPVPADQEIKDVTVSILYDFSVKNFYIVKGILKEEYQKNYQIRPLPVGNGIYRKYYLCKLNNGESIDEIMNKVLNGR